MALASLGWKSLVQCAAHANSPGSPHCCHDVSSASLCFSTSVQNANNDHAPSWGYSSVVECLPTVYEILGSIPALKTAYT